MAAYIFRRLLLIIPTLFGIMLINFAIIQFAPGGPVEQVIAELTHATGGATERFAGGGGDVAGGAQAAGVLATVKRDAIERGGGSWSAEEEAAFKQPTIDMFEEQSHPLYASARLWDDGIIDPRKSREVLYLSLSASLNAPIEDTRFGVFRM